jgi:hypothetical protein
MRTPRRRHRLTLRQSEQLLDGRGGPGDLTWLLADARPLRANGELPGEAVAVAEFRSAAVTAFDPQPRSSSVRAFSLRRSLAVKVLAVATASVAVGGAAVAAGGHLTGPPETASVASSTTHPTTRATLIEDGGIADDADRPGSPTAHPTGSPTGAPVPGHQDDPLPVVGLCRAWVETSKIDAGALARSARFRELATKAGGFEKVAAFCENVTDGWCRTHLWPTAQRLKADDKQAVLRCLSPTGRHTGVPTGSAPKNLPKPPQPDGRDSTRPTALPSGGPARN